MGHRPERALEKAAALEARLGGAGARPCCHRRAAIAATVLLSKAVWVDCRDYRTTWRKLGHYLARRRWALTRRRRAITQLSMVWQHGESAPVCPLVKPWIRTRALLLTAVRRSGLH